MNPRFQQAAWMVLAMTFAAGATIFAKALTDKVPVIQMLWLRLILGSLMLMPFYWKGSGRLVPKFTRLHAIRALTLVGMTGLWFFALKLGPVSQAAVMSYTYPIFILVFAAVFFGQRIRAIEIASIAISLVGVIVVFGMGWTGEALSATDLLQMVVVISSSVLIAIRVCIERVMTFTADPVDILIGSMAIATIALIPLVALEWTQLDINQIVQLVGLSVAATLSQLMVIQLVRSGAWSVVSIFAFWEVLAAIGLAMLVFGESLALPGLVGAVLIIVGGVLQVRHKA